MTILVDLSQIMIANVMQSIRTANELDDELVRHMILNSLRLTKVKFGSEYGEMVICCDSGKFWRRDVFQYYKAGRKKARDASALDWKKIFSILNTVKAELDEFFPYRVVEVPLAEADDVIAVLAAKDSIEHINNNRKVLIVSGDHDFIQLQKYPNVEQWDPVHKKKIVHNDPYSFLKEHIVRGDIGDGVPNFLSADNSLVLGVKQRPITRKVIDRMLEARGTDGCLNDDELRNFERNRLMVDLSCVPDGIKAEILTRYEEQAGKRKDRMLKYFMDKKLSGLFEHINDF